MPPTAYRYLLWLIPSETQEGKSLIYHSVRRYFDSIRRTQIHAATQRRVELLEVFWGASGYATNRKYFFNLI